MNIKLFFLYINFKSIKIVSCQKAQIAIQDCMKAHIKIDHISKIGYLKGYMKILKFGSYCVIEI
jgi:hypothetical protein